MGLLPGVALAETAYCRIPVLPDPVETEKNLRAIPGTVGSGLFLGMADSVFVADDDGQIQIRRRH